MKRRALKTWAGGVAVLLVLVQASAAPAATVRDHRGREIRFAEPFRRIVSLYGAHTENLFALGLDEAVIGVSPHEVFPPQAIGRPVFSYHDGPEKFLAARADLVLIRPMIDRGYDALVRQLERHGIAVVSLQPANAEEMLAYWITLGRLTGREPQAQTMVRTFREAVAAFRELARTVEPRQRVYFEAVHERMKTFQPGSMPIFALETAGGVNAADDAEQVRTTNIAFYGKERLLARGEAIDVYLAQVGAMNRPTLATIRNEPGFELIRAVREGRIHLIDETIVSRPTLRLLLGIWTIGATLYPGAFCDGGAEILIRAGFEPTGAPCGASPPTARP
jgi:iron complex transport system substrate-binding protein